MDDFPPATIITRVGKPIGGKRLVRGSATDNGVVRRVLVNGLEARATGPNFSEWDIEIPEPPSGGPLTVTARAEDAAGNVEQQPHVLMLK